MNSFWKISFRIIGQVFLALISFIVLLWLASLFFISLGQGIGTAMFKESVKAGKSSYAFVAGNKDSKNHLLFLSVEGIILGSPPSYIDAPLGLPRITFGYGVQDILKAAAKDDSIKGVLLYMQTPGGTIFGSYAIFDGVKAYQKATNKPVIAYVEGLSASGGVMAMVGADAIYADQGSLVGSIGVLGPTWRYYNKPTATEGGLLGGGIVTKEGIEETLISAGQSKDLGNPFRRPTPEEIKVLQNGVNIEYDHFVKQVASNRKLDEKVIREQLGALIFDNKTAQEYGLIDGTLNRDGVIAKLAELAKVGEDYQLVRPKAERGGLLSRLFGALGDENLGQAQRRQLVQGDICAMATRLPLLYYGDITRLCF
jgi:protease-4